MGVCAHGSQKLKLAMHALSTRKPDLLCAECVGGLAAGLMAGPLYGTGATWLKKMLPWIRPTEEPTGDNDELEDQAAPNNREMEMQAPLYEAKPNQSAGAKKPLPTYVQDEGTTLV